MTARMKEPPAGGARLIKVLILLMFATFAMTTDSVGTIIPRVIEEFHLGMTAGGAFQYASMSGIGLAAIALGSLADRIGHKGSIIIGLALFCVASGLFALGHDFLVFIILLFVAGLGIGIFKAGALALIGDISRSTREHAATMNLIEGFFGVGAIIGPALVAHLLQSGASWKWIYTIAAMLCLVLIAGCLVARFPVTHHQAPVAADRKGALRLLGDPYALAFGIALMLYVGAEAAVYVWAPTYLSGYDGPGAWLAAYVVAVFFVLRAFGRFLGAWLLARLRWQTVLIVCSAAIALCFWAAVVFGRSVALFSIPATGLFMSVLYPTINSTGISCFDKAQHGAIAGVLLFFTCVSAVLAPLAMGALSDHLGDPVYTMILGTVFATLLAALCGYNWLADPIAARLRKRNAADYAAAG
ncbi:MFS transporter [Sphingomonas sp. MMS24-J13]|uniref:MFS transporter n=1 Tax=Sphingomonas sp. MMS24-J13 TaxID=3238686 RepID=UPI00384CB2DC